jgi:hypothetical protein
MSSSFTIGERELDAILDAWFADGADAAPDRLAEAAIEETATMRQERVMAVPWVEHGSLAWAAVVAAIAVAIGLYIGLTRFTGDENPAPAPPSILPSHSPTSSPDAAAISETRLGTIEWTRSTSDLAIYPSEVFEGDIWARDPETDNWYLYTDDEWRPADPDSFGAAASQLDTDVEGWAVVSPDGPAIMEGPAGEISRDWFDNPGDAAIYRGNGDRWSEIALPTTSIRPMEGVRISSPMIHGTAALDADHWVAPITRMLEVPWGDIYGLFDYTGFDGEPTQVEPWPLWVAESGWLKIAKPGSTPTASSGIARLRVELVDGTDPMIRFTDNDTGDVVHTMSATLTGWTPEEVLAAFRGWGLDRVSLIAYVDGDLTAVTPPWPHDEEWSGSIVTALGRYFTATTELGESGTATAVHLWSSEDGTSWRQVALADITPSAFDYAELSGRDDGLVLAVNGDENSIWTSHDGASWSRADLDIPYLVSVRKTEFGWLADLFDSVAISVDGLQWEVLDLPIDLSDQSAAVLPRVSYLDGRFLAGPIETQNGWVTWIGRISP